MISDQEIRAQAARAAATCAVAVGLGDPGGLLRVAGMLEVYINQGEEAAQKVIDSWSATGAVPDQTPVASPQEHAARSGSPTDVCAQELADEAYLLTKAEEVQDVIRRAEDGKVAGDQVTVDGSSGSLLDYLEHLLLSMKPTSNTTVKADLGL